MPRSKMRAVTVVQPDLPPPNVSGVYTIGELSAYFQITPRSIRFYCERGLIAAQSQAGELRLFDRHNAGRLSLIQKAKGLGLTLREVKDFVADRAPNCVGPALILPLARIESEIAIVEQRQTLMLQQLKTLLAQGQSQREPQQFAVG